MPAPPPVSLWTRIKRAALGFDAWLNASLYERWPAGRRRMGALLRALDKLRVRGAPRAVIDLTGEALTLGTAGAVLSF